jgi:hypothetical protein
LKIKEPVLLLALIGKEEFLAMKYFAKYEFFYNFNN